MTVKSEALTRERESKRLRRFVKYLFTFGLVLIFFFSINTSVYAVRSTVLDNVSNSLFAYSFSKLSSSYSGYAVRVRNSLGSQTNIGFAADGSFDTSAYNSFVNQGDGTGYVVTWYDQSGNGNNLAQTSDSNQPTVNLNTTLSKPAVKFVASSSQYLDTNTLASTTLATVSMVASYDGTQTDNVSGIFLSSTNSTNRFQIWKRYNGGTTKNDFAFFQGGTTLETSETDNTAPNIFTAFFNGNTSNGSALWINGGSAITGTLGSGSWQALRVGHDAGTTYLTGTIYEIIGYNSVLSTSNATAIGDNESDYYNIGFLDNVDSATTVASNATLDNLEASVVRLPDGNLIMSYTSVNNSVSYTKDAHLNIRFSSDNGQTWTNENTNLDGSSVSGFPMAPPNPTGNQGAGEPFLMVAPNGNLIMQTWLSDYSTTGANQGGTWQATSSDNGKTWSQMSQVNFQNFPGGYTYNQNYIFATDDYFVMTPFIYAGARMLQSGNAAASGVVKSIFIKSTDNGETWDYVSDVSGYTSAVGGSNGTIEEGFAYVGNNKIVAVLRGQIGDANGYKSVSTDMGQTWNSGTQTSPGALTVITSQSLHTGRARIKSFSRLYGESNWWNDDMLVMTGFSNVDSDRRPAIWISYDGGSTWGYPIWITSDHGVNVQGYGDMYYDPTLKQLGVLTTDYNGSKRIIKQFKLSVNSLKSYTITSSASSNGSISPDGSTLVGNGNSHSFTITPNTHYHIADVLVDSVSVGAVSSFDFINVATDHTISATFVIDTKTLTYTAGTHGTISGTSPQTINYGTDGSAVTAVADPGYEFSTWSDGSTTNPRTDTNVTDNISVIANFSVTSNSSSSSSSSSSTSSTSTPSCGDQAPGSKAPWLYGAIAQDSDSVLLYFTEADNPVNKYILEYGTKSGDYPYGVQDMRVNSRGQMTFLVKSLSPNTTYYFKVRGGNGCAVGNWSNEISAKTKSLVTTNNLVFVSSELIPIKETQPTETNNSCQTYIVKSGDTLWSIAENLLGDGNKYKEIVEQNKDTYSSLETSNNLKTGWELKVNCGKQTTTKEAKKPTETQGGYDVKVKVVDTAKKPIEGATVTLHSNPQTAKTDKNGIAAFKNVEAGDHKVLIAYNNFEGEQSINLTGNVKEFDLNVTVQQKTISLSPLAYGIIGIMGLVIIVLVVLLIKNKRKE